jgi:hypothetical protein
MPPTKVYTDKLGTETVKVRQGTAHMAKNHGDTYQLIAALRQATALDLNKLAASGINVTISSYTDNKPNHVDTVTLNADVCEGLKIALIQAITSTIASRKQSLSMQLRDIEKAQEEHKP